MPTPFDAARRALCLLAVLFFAMPAQASDQAPSTTVADLPSFKEGVHEALIERVNQAQSREYESVLESLDAFMQTHPKDADVAVERCRFVGHFAGLEDAPIESAIDRSDECQEELKHAVFSDEAPIELYLLELLWGDEAKERAQSLLSPSIHWEPKRRARLHEQLADLYSSTDVMKAGPHATTAIRLDPHSSVRLVAAEYLIRIGAKAAALRMVQEMPKEDWNAGNLSVAVKLLVGMEAAGAANELVKANQAIAPDVSTRVLLARSLFSSGAVDAARRIVKEASEAAAQQKQYGTTSLREIFELERDFGSTEDAAAAYRRLRDLGYSADPFGRHRLSLSLHHPRAPWHWEDTLGIGAFALIIGGIALLPLLVVVPIHYRSVVKQLRGQPPLPLTPLAPWTLRQTWYALAVTSVAGIVAFYFLDYPAFHRVIAAGLDIPDSYEVLSSDRALGNALLLSSAVTALALLPLLRRADLRSLFLGTWSVRRSLLTGIGASVGIFLLAAFLRGFMAGLSEGAAALGTDTTRALQGIRSTYGAVAMILFVAGLIPFIEEFVFRGVLLRTAARHIAFWVAVLLQAALFMIWHEDASSWPVIFVLALTAAWLARRSGGLLAPITLHALNNTFAALSLIGLSEMAKRLA
jgi:membrane protease YdiL (CAAX protease family)